jgi:hypothetical protein
MKMRFGVAAWILIGLFSGPAAVVSVWAIAALATQTGMVVLPGTAPRYAGPQGREGDFSEIYVTKEQSGGSIGLLKQSSHLKADHRYTSIQAKMNSSMS